MSYCRIGGSVLDVKKWIESGTPVDVMSTLNSIVSGNSSATNIQKLFAGMMFVMCRQFLYELSFHMYSKSIAVCSNAIEAGATC